MSKTIHTREVKMKQDIRSDVTSEDEMVEIGFFPSVYCAHFKTEIDDPKICQRMSFDFESSKVCIAFECKSVWKLCPVCREQGEVKRIGERPEICCKMGEPQCDFHSKHGTNKKRELNLIDEIKKSKAICRVPASLLEEIFEKNKNDVDLVSQNNEGYVWVRRDEIRPNKEQPRKYFNLDRIKELAGSIQEVGQTTPIILKKLKNSEGEIKYELLDGERRWKACGLVRIGKMKAVFDNAKNKPEQHLRSVVANFGREGHTPMEIAKSIKKIKNDFGHSDEKIGCIFGKSVWWVSTHSRLLDLHPEVQGMLDPKTPKDKQISVSIAIFILTNSKSPKKQLELAKGILLDRLKTNEAKAFILQQTEDEREGKRKSGLRNRRPSDDYAIFEGLLERTVKGLKLQLGFEEEDFIKMFEKRPLAHHEGIVGLLNEMQTHLDTLVKRVGKIDFDC